MFNFSGVAFISFTALLLLCLPSLAANPTKGKKLARKCSVCHGKLGISRDPEVPHLAGQHAFYIEKSLLDYQSGKREDRRMTLMVKALSKEDIKDLAAWYESLKIKLISTEK